MSRNSRRKRRRAKHRVVIEACDAVTGETMTFAAFFRREWREIERSLAEAKAKAKAKAGP